eukprot:tig00021493_g21856.t1
MGRDRDEEERRRRKEEKRAKKEKEKKRSKLDETPEERRARRLAKKQKKEAKRAEKERSSKKEDKSFFGYTNDNNPFGDSNLKEQFVWKKKNEKLVELGVDPQALSKERERLRREELRREIDKVKKRREEREEEKMRWEEERSRLAREREGMSFQEWEKKEDEFHLKQAIIRSEIRIKEGRAKPIDIIAKNLHLDKDFDIEMNEPYKIFKGLPVAEIEELKADIATHLELDQEKGHREFWNAMMVVCEDELEQARRSEELERQGTRGAPSSSGVHSAVEGDIEGIFRGKSARQLAELEGQCRDEIAIGRGVDVEYWENVLKKLSVFKAKALLREVHAGLLKKRLAQLQQEQARASRGRDPEREGGKRRREDSSSSSSSSGEESERERGGRRRQAASESEGEGRAAAGPSRGGWEEEEEEEDGGRGGAGAGGTPPGAFSPVLESGDVGEAEVVDEAEDRRQLEQQREAILAREREKMAEIAAAEEAARVSAAGRAAMSRTRFVNEDELYRIESAKLAERAEEGEVSFADEVAVEGQQYRWEDKYRPRRPRYFNRVHTGFDWNKYNQTHYDHDNPPPKIVQGYKFNIFYPDLIDKAKSPQFFIEPDTTEDTVLLRFHAGAPYEDVAFRIVNKEWEYSHKRGFKCTFERGIFHLYFNFKRYRYRR